jgi:hypothetical protein
MPQLLQCCPSRYPREFLVVEKGSCYEQGTDMGQPRLDL